MPTYPFFAYHSICLHQVQVSWKFFTQRIKISTVIAKNLFLSYFTISKNSHFYKVLLHGQIYYDQISFWSLFRKKTTFDWTLMSDKHSNNTSVPLLMRKNIKDMKENLKSFLPPIHDQIFFDNVIIFLMMSHDSWEQETIPTKKI